jgi:hypothetical protein
MPKAELIAYATWFHEIMPERLSVLTNAVQSTPGFEDWDPDRSPGSLDRLGAWFSQVVDTRPLTTEELRMMQQQLTFAIEIEDSALSPRTISIALDIGMYVGQVFLTNHPTLKWHQLLKGVSSVDYGQPVLSGFGKMTFNPVHTMKVIAYGFADKTEAAGALRNVYERWVKYVEQ